MQHQSHNGAMHYHLGNMSRFASRLLNWYEENKRSLPWRGHDDPYAVWVSEIMLQQTRVEAAIPYFLRWMERFPSIAALADSTERAVLNAWEGLGYYARARNLRKAAQEVVRAHAGSLPREAEELRKLPGIGRYTAGAIASMAFGADEPALEGNIKRVLARVFNVSEPANSTRGEKVLWGLAAKHLPKGRAGDYNQAMMDLGAAICLPANPRCPVCPLKNLCQARKLGIQTERPVLGTRKAVPHRIHAAAVILRRGRVLLAQRPSSGLLGGMWEFPNTRIVGSISKGLEKAMRRLYDVDVQCDEPLGVVQHGYSHFTVEVHAYRCEISGMPRTKELTWIPVKSLNEYPMGRIDRQIAKKLA